MQPLTHDYYQLYQTLYKQYGSQGWWPSDSDWETMIGAILIQNTNSKNVEQSLNNLRPLTHFEPAAILAMTDEALMTAINPSGFYSAKSRTIQALFRFFAQFQFDLTTVDQQFDTPTLRKQLLAIKGIGPETADVISLYVFNRAVFIPDSYARRLISALEGISLKELRYEPLKKQLEALLLPQMSVEECQEFHALIDDQSQTFLG